MDFFAFILLLLVEFYYCFGKYKFDLLILFNHFEEIFVHILLLLILLLIILIEYGLLLLCDFFLAKSILLPLHRYLIQLFLFWTSLLRVQDTGLGQYVSRFLNLNTCTSLVVQLWPHVDFGFPFKVKT